MTYLNSWDNDVRSASYARLEFPNTYYLAYRDLPQIIQKYANGSKSLDFGCGTGRSTRFVKNLGFDTVGIDISASMIKRARELDPEGIYHLVKDGDYRSVPDKTFNLIVSIFTFDNIPGLDHRVSLLEALKEKLTPDGCIVMLDANARMYTHEWASFTTRAFPENTHARSGEKVKICMTDVDDQTPVEDYLFTIADYHTLFEQAGLKLTETFQPLGRPDEPYSWKSELTIAPWIIYVLTH